MKNEHTGRHRDALELQDPISCISTRLLQYIDPEWCDTGTGLSEKLKEKNGGGW